MRNLLLFIVLLALGCASKTAYIDYERAETFKEPEYNFMKVTEVVEGSQAEAVGIKEGDFLISYNGVFVKTLEELNKEKEKVLEGKDVKMVMLQDGKKLTFTIKSGLIGIYPKPPKVKIPETATTLEGVPIVAWGKTGEATLIGCTWAVLGFLGDIYDYNTLMGYSGAAFQLKWWEKSWCPSAGSIFEDLHKEALYKAVGYNHKALAVRQDTMYKETDEQAMWEAIVEAIDSSIPVIASGAWDPDYGIITGYDKEERIIIGINYFSDGELIASEKMPWEIIIIGDKTEKPAEDETILTSLKMIVELAEEGRRKVLFKEDHYYAVGLHAYEEWAAVILNDSVYPTEGDSVTNPKDFDELMHTNKWVLDNLIDGRTTGAGYLKSIVDKVSTGAAAHINKAIEHYEKELELLVEREFYLFVEEGKTPMEELLVTHEGRQVFADWLLQLRDADKTAVDEIKLAIENF